MTMSWEGVKDGTICVTPVKTKRISGARPWIPTHPALQEVLNAVGQRHDPADRIWTAVHVEWLRPWLHGREDCKGWPAGALCDTRAEEGTRRLAEAGCTANEIAPITGHATLQEVSHYTKAAEQSSTSWRKPP